MAEPLTKRQKEVFDYVTQYIEVHGYAPSYREIAEAFSLGSVATVADHIDTLVAKGLLKNNYQSARYLIFIVYVRRALPVPFLAVQCSTQLMQATTHSRFDRAQWLAQMVGDFCLCHPSVIGQF